MRCLYSGFNRDRLSGVCICLRGNLSLFLDIKIDLENIGIFIYFLGNV